LHKERPRRSVCLIIPCLGTRKIGSAIPQGESDRALARIGIDDGVAAACRVYALYVLCIRRFGGTRYAKCVIRHPGARARARARVLTGLEHAACCRYSVMYVSRHYREFAAVKLVHRGCTGKRSFSIPRFNSDSANSLPICIEFFRTPEIFPRRSFLSLRSLAPNNVTRETLRRSANSPWTSDRFFEYRFVEPSVPQRCIEEEFQLGSRRVRMQRVSRTLFRNSFVHAW